MNSFSPPENEEKNDNHSVFEKETLFRDDKYTAKEKQLD